MNINKADIDLLAMTLKEHGLTSIEYQDNEFSLKLENQIKMESNPFFLNDNKKFEVQSNQNNSEENMQVKSETNKTEEVKTTKQEEVNGFELKSPIVGNFYTTKRPDEPPFIKVGDKVSKGDTVAIIEAMKVLNEVKSPVSGEVIKIHPENGMFVDAATVIIEIKEN